MSDDRRKSDDAVPSTIGRYHISGLGFGAMGAARQPTTLTQ
jgi:hypothetical protein